MRFQPPVYEDIPTVAEMVAAMDVKVTGLERAKLRLALQMRRFMVAAAKGDPRPTSNVVVLSPTGSGKTFLIKTLLDICPVIWAEANATEYSDVGYVGRDLTSMYLGLLQPRWRGRRGDDQPPWSQAEISDHAERWGVVIIDEFDKLRTNRVKVAGEREVGRALQAELLKLIEGGEVLCKRNDDDRGVLLRTHNIMHIAVGAFQGINDVVVKDFEQAGQSVPMREQAYTKASTANLIDYGFLEELVGRFSTIVTLPPLDGAHLSRIFREHVVPAFERECRADGIELIVEEGAIAEVGNEMQGMRIGARALGPKLDECLSLIWAKARRGDRIRVTAQSITTNTAVLEQAVAV